MAGGAVASVAFRNVPSYVIARAVPVGDVAVDVACGGAIYAFAPASQFGLRVVPADLPRLIAVGREVKRALDGTAVARHPDDDRLSGIYGTVLHEDLGPRHQRNVAIFADGEVDRSPTGSATSARTALLLADGRDRARTTPGATTRSSARPSTHERSARRPTGCSPRSRGRRSGPASTASSSTRATRSAPASCCDEACAFVDAAEVERRLSASAAADALEAALRGGPRPRGRPAARRCWRSTAASCS